MIWVFRQLGAPLRYLRISQGGGFFTSKATYDYVFPALLAGGATVAVWRFSFALGLYSQDGFIAGILNLLNLLIAFFIAALAAVATFDRPGLDDKLKGEPATMKRRTSKGVVRDHVLTHRQFICYLFGYLSFSSIALLLALYGFRLVGYDAATAANLEMAIAGLTINLKPALRIIGTFLFFFIFFQIIITMLLGVYFLSDRLQFLDDPND